MNIVDVRTGLRRLSVPRRSAEREGSDRRQYDRRQQTTATTESISDVSENIDTKKYVRVSLTPGERTLLQDMYLTEDES